jgi:hypothetical protein
VRTALGIGILVGGLVLAGCSSSSSAPQGTLAGQLVAKGGSSSPGSVHPVSGAVVAVASTGKTKTAVVGASGRFDLLVPVGSYTIVGTTDGGPDNCTSRSKLLVRSSAVTTAQVVCPAR